MKKVCIKVFGMVALLLTVVLSIPLFTACGGTSKSSLGSVKNLYAFSCFSAGSFLANNQSTAKTISLANEEIVDQNVETIDKYLKYLDGFVGNKQNYDVKVSSSGDADFPNKLEANIKQLDGKAISFVMVYKETLIQNNKNVSNPDDAVEQESKIEGKMTLNNNEYTFTGEKEVEKDEIELSIKATASNGDYVILNQEIEQGENEFAYSYYKAGQTNASESFSIELEENKDEVELELGAISNGVKTYYKIEKNNNKFEITYLEKEVLHKIEATIKEKDGVRYYVYKTESAEIEKEID